MKGMTGMLRSMQWNPLADRFGRRRAVAWPRALVHAELTLLLVAGVALTIMPVILLGWLADAGRAALAFAAVYRPIVALIGLGVVILTLIAWMALRRRPAEAAARPDREDDRGPVAAEERRRAA
jgi:hypothetical protein